MLDELIAGFLVAVVSAAVGFLIKSRFFVDGYELVVHRLVLVALLTAPTTLHSQERLVYDKVVIATFSESEISVDGRLNERAWEAALPATGFTQKDPSEGEPATEWTEVRVLYDAKNIYIGVYGHDGMPEGIVVRDIARDFEWLEQDTLDFNVLDTWLDQDVFGVLLDTFNDDRNGFLMLTTPGGGKRDIQFFNEGRDVRYGWEGIWHVEARIHEDGWTAEFAIPFETLNSSEEKFQVWGINFFRVIRRKNESTWWSHVPRRYGYLQVSRAGEVRALERAREGTIRRKNESARWSPVPRPYGSFQISRAGESRALQTLWQGGERQTQTEGEEQPKKLTVKLASTATTHRFPSQELETARDLDVSADVKYRLAPSLALDFTLNPDFSHVEVDVSTTVSLTRFSSRFPEKREFFLENAGIFKTGEAYSVGPRRRQLATLFSSRRIGLSAKGEPIPIFGGARLTGRAGPYYLGFMNVQTRSDSTLLANNFTVARGKRDILANSDVGVLFINRQSQQSGDYHRTFGAEANFQFFTDLKFNALLAKTVTPDRRGEDGMATVEMLYRSNLFRFLGSYSDIGKEFNPALGIVSRRGRRIAHGEFGLNVRLQKEGRLGSFIRDIFPLIISDYTILPTGETEIRMIRPRLQIKFQDGGAFETQYTQNFKLGNKKPCGIGHPAGDYGFDEVMVRYFSDRSKVFSIDTRYQRCDVSVSDKTTLRLAGRLQPSSRFYVSVNVARDRVELPDSSYSTHIVGLKAKYNFNPEMFVNASIFYNGVKDQVNSHIRFRLIHGPSSDLFVVYSEQRDNRMLWTDRAVFVKWTRLFGV